MKFAFSTVACPKWDFETIAARAKEYGYDGVEVRASASETILSAANLFLSDPAKVKATFSEQDVRIACLSSAIAVSGNKKHDVAAAAECRRFIETAAAVGCGLVKVLDTQAEPGSLVNPLKWDNHSRSAAGQVLVDWLLPLADYAAQHDVMIVVENALSFRGAKELWLILEQVGHPSVACCWDAFNAALIGEQPAISVPVLNSRIQYVQVKDAKIGPLGASFCKLGEGDVPLRKLMIRLMGIGYQGYVTFEWEKAWLPGLAEPEEVLPDAVKRLRGWTTPPAPEKPKKAHAAAAK